jgi:single-strand DNA-binding protein
MASVNKVILIGNLGQDPELRNTNSGKAVTTMRMATTDVWTDQAGERQERTEWHSVVVWGRQAENCVQYLQKGRPVYVEGRLQTRKWQDRDGNDRYSTEIVADRVQFLGGRSDGDAPRASSDSKDDVPSFPSQPEAGAGSDVPF